jgi:hypothetical protein
MDCQEVVRGYKRLTKVERAFRSIKTEDLRLRPIWHYDENRVKTHIFICMLSYYVLWHLKEAWRPMTFADEEIDLKETRDPVALSEQSESCKKKLSSKVSDDGLTISSFRRLFNSFNTISRSTLELKLTNNQVVRYNIKGEMDAHQAKAFELLETFKM